MRTEDQINKILNQIESPYSVENILTSADIAELISIFENEKNKTEKNTGPITVDLQPYQNHKIIINLLEKIKLQIGEFKITAALFFYTDFPHIIHNDDTFELPDTVYKAITVPLRLTGNYTRYPELCFFDQFYFHGPAKFFRDDTDIPTFYNKQVYDYKSVYNLLEDNFDELTRIKYFTHLKPQWLHGLSLHSTQEWIPGNAIIFDSTRLHCASDFRKLGITSKLGISIFTKK